jgi:hypothetical protein
MDPGDCPPRLYVHDDARLSTRHATGPQGGRRAQAAALRDLTRRPAPCQPGSDSSESLRSDRARSGCSSRLKAGKPSSREHTHHLRPRLRRSTHSAGLLPLIRAADGRTTFCVSLSARTAESTVDARARNLSYMSQGGSVKRSLDLIEARTQNDAGAPRAHELIAGACGRLRAGVRPLCRDPRVSRPGGVEARRPAAVSVVAISIISDASSATRHRAARSRAI